MGDNARILYNYAAWDAGSVSSTSDSSGRRDENALLDPPGAKWVTAVGQDGAQRWTNNLGSAVGISCAWAFAFNWSAGATVRLQANSSNSWGAPPVNELLPLVTDPDGVVYPRIGKVFASVQTYQYWSWYIDDPSNPANRLETGRFIAGQEYELSRNFTRGARFVGGDPSVIKHIPGSLEQAQAVEYLKKYRQLHVSFKVVGATEEEKWMAIFNRIGNSRPCVLMLDPTNKLVYRSAYCYLMVNLDVMWDLYTRFNIMALVFEEKTR